MVKPGDPAEYTRPGPPAQATPPTADSGGSGVSTSPENQAFATYLTRQVVRAHKIIDIQNYAPHEADPVRYTRRLVFGAILGKGIDDNWWDRHKPCVGGFYVIFENGRAGYLPSTEFERRYAPFDGQASASDVTAEPPYPGAGTPTAVAPGDGVETARSATGPGSQGAVGIDPPKTAPASGTIPATLGPGNQ